MPEKPPKSLPRTVFIEGERPKKKVEAVDVYKGIHLSPDFLKRMALRPDKLDAIHREAIEVHLKVCPDKRCNKSLRTLKGEAETPLLDLAEVD